VLAIYCSDAIKMGREKDRERKERGRGGWGRNNRS
jgi:hypothetical protein